MALWCKLNQLAALSNNDWVRLHRLFPDSGTTGADASQPILEPSLSTGSDSWDESWPLEEEKTENSSTVQSRAISWWLQNAQVAVAPANENLVVAFQNEVAFFALNPSNEIRSIGSAEIPKDEICLISSAEIPNFATAIECIPIIANSKSTPKPYEWLCFVVGMADGSLYFYTESGTLLLKQKFARSAVKSFHLATVYSHAQELSIFHEDCSLVLIDGLSLLTNLRVCRNRIASNLVTVDQLSSADFIEISFKKRRPENLETVSAHVCCGLAPITVLDQMEFASIDDANASIRPQPGQHTVYACIGRQPYVGFYWLDNEREQTNLSEVFTHFAGKVSSALTSNLGGWFGGGSQRGRQKTPPEDVRPTVLSKRFALNDTKRNAERLILAPSGRFALVTDGLARVAMIEIFTGRMIRIWKGYRDAQCGWIESNGTVDDRKVSVLYRIPSNSCPGQLFL